MAIEIDISNPEIRKAMGLSDKEAGANIERTRQENLARLAENRPDSPKTMIINQNTGEGYSPTEQQGKIWKETRQRAEAMEAINKAALNKGPDAGMFNAGTGENVAARSTYEQGKGVMIDSKKVNEMLKYRAGIEPPTPSKPEKKKGFFKRLFGGDKE